MLIPNSFISALKSFHSPIQLIMVGLNFLEENFIRLCAELITAFTVATLDKNGDQ
jgi:hypothetical protein